MRWRGIVACSFALWSFSGCVTAKDFQPVDASRVILLQLEPMAEGEDIAILKTDYGEIRMRFFPSEAPEAVSNFMQLARQGFYDEKPILPSKNFLSGEEHCLLSGSSSEDGKRGISAVNAGKPFKKEVSMNLWHFAGAVSVLGDRNDKGDSRFFITGSRTVPEETLKEIQAACYPEKVIDAFKERGGIPEFALEYTIFAQVYDGQNTVDQILSQMGKEGAEEILVHAIEITEYEEE